MDDTSLEKLKAIDPAILRDVVRQDQRNPSFEITNWSVRRLSDQGIINPDGLWLYSGEGNDGGKSQSWSVVLKILERSREDAPPYDLWYWKRELLWMQSGHIERLPGPVKCPRFYKAEETLEGAWLWQEHVKNERPDPWSLEDYAFAARQLGLWNGAYVCGTPLPDETWFTRQHYRSWYTKTNPEQDFQFSLNQKYLFGEFRDRYEQLWAEREMFYHVLETLPEVFSHLDSQRRNLFIRKDNNEQDELVIVDWAVCGYAPLGVELFALVGMSAALLEWSPSELVKLDQAAFASYLQGLGEAGWSENADVIRLAYTAWITAYFGIVFPNITALWCTPDFNSYASQQFGFVEEELFLQWLPLFFYSLDCADEARLLMKKLGYS
jgi:Phosphotransferase enzyme family